ncbi:MAG: hypothetical protein Q7T80_07000 [Methanoregula sp.]|nr:hypothetical protein [Methanoregula sp.]
MRVPDNRPCLFPQSSRCPSLYRSIAKRPTLTGSGLPTTYETDQAPWFQRG